MIRRQRRKRVAWGHFSTRDEAVKHIARQDFINGRYSRGTETLSSITKLMTAMEYSLPDHGRNEAKALWQLYNYTIMQLAMIDLIEKRLAVSGSCAYEYALVS